MPDEEGAVVSRSGSRRNLPTTSGNGSENQEDIQRGSKRKPMWAKKRERDSNIKYPICVSKKPKEDCQNCECVPDSESGGGGGGVSVLERLSVQPVSKIDSIRELYPFPCDALPRNFLPAWRDLPLYVKLPNVPAPPGALVFSRGGLGKSLLKRDAVFTTIDPLHQFRVPYSDYNALHDKHAREYLKRPHVLRLLICQGLITENCDVVCSQKEFNRFRTYLASLNNEKIAELLAEGDKRWLYERQQLLELYRYKRMLDGLNEDQFSRSAAAEHRYRARMEEIFYRYEEKRRADCIREMQWLQEKERKNINRRLYAIEKCRINAQRRFLARQNEAKWRNQIVMAISYRDVAAAERVQREKCLEKQAQDQFLSEWLQAKSRYQEEDQQRKAAVQKKLSYDLKVRAVQRQEKVERYREAIPEIINKKKAEQQRVWNLVRKYFYRWLKKVQDRKSRKPDALHQSLWDIGGVMDETVKYLRKESGYETFDDFMMTVLKLKEEIKARLAEEEVLEEQERLAKMRKSKTKQSQRNVAKEENGEE